MNVRILFFAGLLLALPCTANAKKAYIDHEYSVQCETLDKTVCTVRSNRAIKSVRVEFLSHEVRNWGALVKKEFEDCPTEVSVAFAARPKAKFFIQTCDGSSGVRIIEL